MGDAGGPGEKEDRGEGWWAIRPSVTGGVHSHALFTGPLGCDGYVTAPPPALTYQPSHRGTTIRPERDRHFLEQMLAFPVKSAPVLPRRLRCV